MINVFQKIKFFLTRPKVVVIAGRNQKITTEAVKLVLRRDFKIGQNILVYPAELQDMADLKFILKNSRTSILVATHVGAFHEEREFFAGSVSDIADAESLAQIMLNSSYLVLNFDDETVRSLREKTAARVLTFGFAARADIQATDVILTQTPNPGTNFKINFQGNIVPVWLQNVFGKEHIYAALAAAAVGEILDLNLVEVSDSLKKV